MFIQMNNEDLRVILCFFYQFFYEVFDEKSRRRFVGPHPNYYH